MRWLIGAVVHRFGNYGRLFLLVEIINIIPMNRDNSPRANPVIPPAHTAKLPSSLSPYPLYSNIKYSIKT